MKLTNRQLRQIIKEELESVMSEVTTTLSPGDKSDAVYAHLKRLYNTSPDGAGPDGKMRGEAYISQDEYWRGLKILGKYEQTGEKPSKEDWHFLAELGPSHEEDDTLGYKHYLGYLERMKPMAGASW